MNNDSDNPNLQDITILLWQVGGAYQDIACKGYK